MKIVKFQDLEADPSLKASLSQALHKGSLICVPCRGTYRILADLNNKSAVNSLLQSKRRTKKAPSLVFIDDVKRLEEVAGNVCSTSRKLAKAFWPGPLTIVFEAHKDLPSKIVEELTRSTGVLGIRIPASDLTREILREFDGPVLVSSANRSRKHGESSPAQIQKNFLGRIDFFVDAGDLPQASPSTVVKITDGQLNITREGSLSAQDLEAALS